MQLQLPWHGIHHDTAVKNHNEEFNVVIIDEATQAGCVNLSLPGCHGFCLSIRFDFSKPRYSS